MSRRLHARLVAFGFAAGLVLQAAMPLLASAAAGWRGVPVAEVCSVHGVAMPAMASHDGPTDLATLGHGAPAGHDGHAGHADHAGHLAAADPAPPAGDAGVERSTASAAGHCALAGWVALAAEAPTALSAPTAAPAVAQRSTPSTAFVFDAAARWVALLERGPPRA